MSKGEGVFVGLEVQGGGGVEVFRDVRRGGEGVFSISSVGGVWIFSGMTHYNIVVIFLHDSCVIAK